MNAVRSNLTAEQSKLADLRSKLREYERRLFETPVVEREFKTLNRNYDNAVAKFDELKNKQIEARLAQELESGESGEQFLLASPPFTPKTPSSPNRIGIILLGMLLAGAISVGIVATLETLDTAVHDSRTIAMTLNAPPLAVIPNIQ